MDSATLERATAKRRKLEAMGEQSIYHFEKGDWDIAALKQTQLQEAGREFIAGFCHKLQRFFIIIW